LAAIKSDAAQIRAFLRGLGRAGWLGAHRSDWPNQVYHYTDAHNLASILKSGRLLSRDQCRQQNVAIVDSADQEIIQQSRPAHKWVRLYFRPLTPTQYHMEGTQPVAQRRHGAWCPIPVFLIFDSAALLCRKGCSFSDGNIAKYDHRIGDDVKFLRSLKFEDIYHLGPVPADDKPQIIFARNAEVLVESHLGLEDLRHVVCRTPAERETLLYLLGNDATKWQRVIRLEQMGEALFYRHWAFVERVALLDDAVQVRFRRPAAEYELQVTVWDAQRQKQPPVVKDFGRGLLPTTALVPVPSAFDEARVRVQLEGCTAYHAVVTQRQLF
jgi:hypothetical protein